LGCKDKLFLSNSNLISGKINIEIVYKQTHPLHMKELIVLLLKIDTFLLPLDYLREQIVEYNNYNN